MTGQKLKFKMEGGLQKFSDFYTHTTHTGKDSQAQGTFDRAAEECDRLLRQMVIIEYQKAAPTPRTPVPGGPKFSQMALYAQAYDIRGIAHKEGSGTP